jgi:type 1 glutamine amidotransferase
MKSIVRRLIPALAPLLFLSASAEPAVKPLKALLVIGGCCHDYAVQKDLLESGIEARANIEVDVCFSPDKTTKATFTCYDKADWAEAYDVIIHDECSANINDPAIVNRILDPHRKGKPAVNLHCAMHSYRTEPYFKTALQTGAEHAMWFDFLGLQSSGHGKQMPINVTYVDATNPITKGLVNWTTINEELYNNIRVHETAKPLAVGKQGAEEKVIAWTNEYSAAKTRVFSTTLGHNNDTVSDARYLDFVTRGLLWSCDKLDKDGKPLAGYGPKGQ